MNTKLSPDLARLIAKINREIANTISITISIHEQRVALLESQGRNKEALALRRDIRNMRGGE